MSDQQREVSEVNNLEPGGVDDQLDVAPPADAANQTENGAPKNYGDRDPDLNLPPAGDPK